MKKAYFFQSKVTTYEDHIVVAKDAGRARRKLARHLGISLNMVREDFCRESAKYLP